MVANRPPRDITPQLFFSDWLPAEFAKTFGALGTGQAAGDLTVRVKLDGATGGIWDLNLRGGQLEVTEPGQSEPDVTVIQSVSDWKASAVGVEGAIDLAPPQASPMDILFVDPASRQILRTVKGTIRFLVTGYAGRDWQLVVKLGSQPLAQDPNATIAVDAESYSKMLARTLSPPEAFFTGKVKLSGDAGIAMQLGGALMPRFN